jgi:hypothetical protein
MVKSIGIDGVYNLGHGPLLDWCLNQGAGMRILRWTPFFGQDCVKLSYGAHGWGW